MATLDLAGIITRICTDLRAKFADKSVETSKQDMLVSGTNIKTINNESLLGSGDLTISGGAGSQTTWFGTGATATTVDGVKCVPVSSNGWTFSAGNILVVMMSSANLTITTQVVALSVNGSAPVSIARDGAVLSAANEVPRNTFIWDDQEIVSFVYDGEYFQVCSRSLGDINVVIATCNADGTDRFLDMRAMVGIRERDFTKRNNLYVVKMTTDGTTANYTGTDPLLLRYEGATATASSLEIIKNGHLIVGSNNELSWVAGEFLLFAYDPFSMNPHFVAKSNPTPIKTINGTSLLGSGNISTAELPTVTTSDNGKVLQVVSGAWAAASLPSANGVSF